MGVEYKDYYKLLGVERNAGKDEISRAFKKLARKYHPDMNPDNKEAEDKFKDINEAYEVLKDEEKRKLYDQLGPNWQHGQNFQQPPGFESFTFGGGQGFGQSGGFGGMGGFGGASGFSDFFETLFGGAGRGRGFGPDPFSGFTRRPQRGRDVEAELGLTLEEAHSGGKKSVSISGPGMGGKSLEINIPVGVKEGARIRLSGQGDPATGGDQAGDLYLRVKLLPHRHFALEGNNVLYELNLAPWEAALGVKVRVPTLGGEVELSVPPGSGSGKRFRLRGKGLGGGGSRGDQYVRLNIKVPHRLEPEERELWEKLAEVSKFKAR